MTWTDKNAAAVNEVSLKPTIFIHAVCWSAYIAYEMLVLSAFRQKLEPVTVYLTFYLVNISYFYATAVTLTKIFTLGTWPVIKGIIYYLLIVVILAVIKILLSWLTYQTSPVLILMNWHNSFFSSLFRAWYFMMLGGFYWAASHVALYRLRLARIEAAYLRQRISPHLLFNSLNFIYSGVQECSEDAASAVLLLADLMRSSLAEPGPDGKITLREELEQVGRLVDINQLRFAGGMPVHCEIGTCPPDLRIAPLMLVTLAENVFKHGDLRPGGAAAQLRVNVSDAGRLAWHNSNGKSHRNGSSGTGMGLAHVRERLEQFYKGNYDFRVEETEDKYQLDLTIWL